MKSLLEAQDIEASLETAFMAVSFAGPAAGGSRTLYVQRRDADRARELVDEFLCSG